MLNVDKVFVLHVKKGYEERERFINKQFAEFGIEFEYVLDGDIDDLTDELKKHYFSDEMHKNLSVMSCAMKHIYAHQRIVDGGYKAALIFEDDIVLDKHFIKIFNQCMQEVKGISKDTCIYYSNACNMYVPLLKSKGGVSLYKAEKSRAADSYSITGKVAQKRLDFIKEHKCMCAIDHQFNYMDPKINVYPYWCHPTIVEQGSMNGLFDSSIDTKRKNSMYRKINWQLQKLFKKTFRRMIN